MSKNDLSSSRGMVILYKSAWISKWYRKWNLWAKEATELIVKKGAKYKLFFVRKKKDEKVRTTCLELKKLHVFLNPHLKYIKSPIGILTADCLAASRVLQDTFFEHSNAGVANAFFYAGVANSFYWVKEALPSCILFSGSFIGCFSNGAEEATKMTRAKSASA